MVKMNPVVHFEMPYKDVKRMTHFYSEAFGWQMQEMGAKMNDYVLATTAESDEKGPMERGAINGGFFPWGQEASMQVPSLVVSVDNIEEAMERVRHAGGRIDGFPMEIPGVGKYVPYYDSEDNHGSLMQPITREEK